MKRKIRVVDNINNKIIESAIIIPDKAHLEAQIRYPHLVQRDKTKYTRKIKHKKLLFN